VKTLDFSGQVVVVTGGARGLGRVIAEEFMAAVVSISAFAIKEIQAKALIETTAARFGRVDVLVNNAGGSPAAPSADVSPRFVTSIVSLNLLAPFFCAQAANAVMQGQPDGGSIVNIGSVSGARPWARTAADGAGEARLGHLTESLAVEWAPKVRVNYITAGLLDTGAGADHYGGPDGLARVAATIPIQRMGTPEDIAGACLYLASSLASFATGGNLVIHGGGEWPGFLQAARG
jgi:NAD(P)-dependent dehydrogenase (short-subunit alcohol dehydrogenase family)